MIDDHTLSHVLDRWLADGPTEIPDRVFDVVAAGIARQRQGPAWRPDWRPRTMNSFLRLGIAVAAVIAFSVAGFALLAGPSSNGVGGSPQPTPEVTPSASAVASPSAAEIVCEDDLPGCAGALYAGKHRSAHFGPKVVYTTPAGWTNSIDTTSIFKLDPPDSSDPSILIWSDVQIAKQTASCEPAALSSRASPQEWVDFVTTHPGLVASRITPLFVYGGQARDGSSVDVTVAPGWTQTCPGDANPSVALIAHLGDPKGMYGVDSTQGLRMVFLTVGTEPVVIEVYGPKDQAAFASKLTTIQPVLDSLVFGCGPSVPRPCGMP